MQINKVNQQTNFKSIFMSTKQGDWANLVTDHLFPKQLVADTVSNARTKCGIVVENTQPPIFGAVEKLWYILTDAHVEIFANLNGNDAQRKFLASYSPLGRGEFIIKQVEALSCLNHTA